MKTSQRSMSNTHGRVFVANDALRQQLVDESVAMTKGSTSTLVMSSQHARSSPSLGNSMVTNRQPGRASRGMVQPPVHARTRRTEADRERARDELREQYEEEQDRIQRAMQLRREQHARREEQRFADMYNELMMEEQDFVSLVKEYCVLDDENRRRKQEALCREWHEKVYDKIQRQIGKQLKNMSSHEIAERRRALYQQFLNAANSKETGLFRDIILENEYDPMIAHEHTLKFDPRTEHDPVKLEINKALREQQTLPGDQFKEKRLGRDTLKVTMWDKLDATPYGRFNKMMASSKADHGTFKTNLTMDDYTFPRGKEVTDPEFPKGKRTFPNWTAGKTLHDLNTGQF